MPAPRPLIVFFWEAETVSRQLEGLSYLDNLCQVRRNRAKAKPATGRGGGAASVRVRETLADEIRCLFRDHDRRRVGVAGDQRGHHRGVYDTDRIWWTCSWVGLPVPTSYRTNEFECALGYLGGSSRTTR